MIIVSGDGVETPPETAAPPKTGGVGVGGKVSESHQEREGL